MLSNSVITSELSQKESRRQSRRRIKAEVYLREPCVRKEERKKERERRGEGKSANYEEECFPPIEWKTKKETNPRNASGSERYVKVMSAITSERNNDVMIPEIMTYDTI